MKLCCIHYYVNEIEFKVFIFLYQISYESDRVDLIWGLRNKLLLTFESIE